MTGIVRPALTNESTWETRMADCHANVNGLNCPVSANFQDCNLTKYLNRSVFSGFFTEILITKLVTCLKRKIPAFLNKGGYDFA